MRKKTTVHMEEDTHQWFIRMRAITGQSNRELLQNAIKLYAALLNYEKFSSLDIPESEVIRRALVEFVNNSEPVCLPKSFD